MYINEATTKQKQDEKNDETTDKYFFFQNTLRITQKRV
jgi:hypothetical protein